MKINTYWIITFKDHTLTYYHEKYFHSYFEKFGHEGVINACKIENT